jgi:hypothetical protein
MASLTPTTQIWFRNPRNYMREVIEAGAMNVAWDFGTLVKYKIDPERFATLHYGAGQEWRGLVIANEGALEIGPERGMDNPLGVYPVWSFVEEVEILETMIANPVGDDPTLVNDLSIPVQQRPVAGQRHVIVVCDLPSASSGVARSFMRKLVELQAENPDCTIHVHGLYAFKTIFGLGFKSADWEARTDSSQGVVVLPNGKQIKEDKSPLHSQWIRLLGMRPVELKQAEKRCIYNIRSALWAGDNYQRAVKFKTTGIDDPDTTSPSALMEIQQVKSYAQGLVAREGDKFTCNTCSLASKCKYFREGSVCTLPASQTHDLAKMFGSRDADQIVDGLGILVKANTRRLEMGLAHEDEEGELNPKIGKLLDDVFTQGQKLAKLVDPGRFTAGKVSVNVERAQVFNANPNQLIAEIVRSLEDQGFSREEITKEMIAGILANMTNGGEMPAIEGEIVEQS